MPLPFLLPAAVAIASEVFPLIATRLGGQRGGELARTVVETAASVVGVENPADTETVLTRLRENRSAFDELRRRLAELDAEEHARELEDRASARNYQIAVGSDGRRRADVMLISISLGLALCIGAVVALPLADVPVPEFAVALLTTIAGAFLKMLSDAFAFEFGSSRGSKQKDLSLETFASALAASAPSPSTPAQASRSGGFASLR